MYWIIFSVAMVVTLMPIRKSFEELMPTNGRQIVPEKREI